MNDTDALTAQEILACTLIGESESLGPRGMTGTALTVLNRANANIHWLGGVTVRGVCLYPGQYDVWLPGDDRIRVMKIAQTDPSYPPYEEALKIASDVMTLSLEDFTCGAVSYFDPPANPKWARGKNPCFVDGNRYYFDLAAIK